MGGAFQARLNSILGTRMQVLSPAAPSVVDASTREFLVWVARAPRTYADAIDVWGSHCPRYTVWEDALGAGLVQVETCFGKAIDAALVTLTQRGEATLASG